MDGDASFNSYICDRRRLSLMKKLILILMFLLSPSLAIAQGQLNITSIAGVDCTGATDSSAGLNTFFSTGTGVTGITIVIPPVADIK